MTASDLHTSEQSSGLSQLLLLLLLLLFVFTQPLRHAQDVTQDQILGGVEIVSVQFSFS